MKHGIWAALLIGLSLLGAAIAIGMWTGVLPNPVLLIHIDSGTVLVFPILLLVVGVGLEWLVFYREQRQRRRLILHAQKKADEERRSFQYRLDHEIKNPLTALRAGMANLLGTNLADDQRATVTGMEAQVLRLSRLLSDMRKLAELETRPLVFAPVDVGDLLREVKNVAQERPETRDRRLTLTVPQVPWPLPSIQGDRDLLFLMIYNLMDNAIKFGRPGDAIELRAFEDGAHVVIELADTGPGIPEEEIPRVWEELYRGEKARGVPGSGLGLALVKAIAGRHNGRITVRSRVSEGTVFTLRLPKSG